MAFSIFNNLLQSPLKGIARGTQNFLGNQGPFPLQFGFRFSRESWEVRQALLSRMDHTEKFKRFRSGLLEGQSSLLINAEMWAWILRWVNFLLFLGAASGRKVQGAPSKCSRAHGNSSPSKMSQMYRWLFNFTPEGTKTMGNLPVAVTATQTTTEVGLWRRLSLLHLYPKHRRFDSWRKVQRQISSRQRTPNWAACFCIL